jgi:hypothetical protein
MRGDQPPQNLTPAASHLPGRPRGIGARTGCAEARPCHRHRALSPHRHGRPAAATVIRYRYLTAWPGQGRAGADRRPPDGRPRRAAASAGNGGHDGTETGDGLTVPRRLLHPGSCTRDTAITESRDRQIGGQRLPAAARAARCSATTTPPPRPRPRGSPLTITAALLLEQPGGDSTRRQITRPNPNNTPGRQGPPERVTGLGAWPWTTPARYAACA